MKTVLLVALLVSVAVMVSARPQEPVPIVRFENDLKEDGSYKFAFETGDGIVREETGVQKQITSEASGSTSTGSVSWKTPDGKTVTMTFVADENGYQPKITIS